MGAYTRSMVSSMATKKVTVTIPEELLDEIRADAAERGLSAYVTEALRFKRDRDRRWSWSTGCRKNTGRSPQTSARQPSQSWTISTPSTSAATPPENTVENTVERPREEARR